MAKVTPLLTDIYALIRLAGSMVRETGMPDLSELKGTGNLPKSVYQGLSAQETRAREQCRTWGIELAAIADRIRLQAAPRPEPEALSPAAARSLGAVGAPATDETRQAFEAWMDGHCWALAATWDGAGYIGPTESVGNPCPHATMTRMLWAAWRDCTALHTVSSGD